MKFLKFILLIFIMFPTGLFAKEIALSFDDAPWRDGQKYTGLKRTERLISELKKANVPSVVIYATPGRNDNPLGKKRLKMYGEAGHIIANHTYSHMNLEKNTPEDYIQDILKAENILKKIPNFKKWFRYPYLREGNTVAKRDAVRTRLESLGYSMGYVTIDNFDYYMDSLIQDALKENKKINWEKLKELYIKTLLECAEFYDNIAVNVLGRSPKHVLLLHENDLSALYVGYLVKAFRESGWTIISPEEAYKDPIATIAPNTLRANQGRIVAIAKDREYGGADRHPTESAEYLDQLFIDSNIYE